MGGVVGSGVTSCGGTCGAGADDGGRGAGDDANDLRFIWTARNDGEVSGLGEDTFCRNITESVELDLIASTTRQHSAVIKRVYPLGRTLEKVNEPVEVLTAS